MIIFALSILFRALSGFQNGYGYAKGWTGLLGFTGLMILAIIYSLTFMLTSWIRLLMIPTGFSAIAIVFLLSDRKWYKYIHSVETICTGCFILTLLLIDWRANIIPLTFAHYPGMLLHKIGVNVPPSGTAWNHNGTNDPTGETVEIFSINFWRTSFSARLILAGVSVVGFVVYMLF